MESDIHLKGEIDAFWGDIKATEEQLSYERQNYARTLKNGLGDDIIKQLNKPPKSKLVQKVKNRIYKFYYKLKSRE
jgi:hypothetical protein